MTDLAAAAEIARRRFLRQENATFTETDNDKFQQYVRLMEQIAFSDSPGVVTIWGSAPPITRYQTAGTSFALPDIALGTAVLGQGSVGSFVAAWLAADPRRGTLVLADNVQATRPHHNWVSFTQRPENIDIHTAKLRETIERIFPGASMVCSDETDHEEGWANRVLTVETGVSDPEELEKRKGLFYQTIAGHETMTAALRDITVSFN